MIEQFLDAFVEVLDVLFRLVGKSIAGRSSPDQAFIVRVEEVKHESTDLVGLGCRGRLSKSSKSPASKTSPTPTPSEADVKSVKSLLIPRYFDSEDSDLASGRHLRPALCRQRGINRVLDPADPQRVLRLNPFPVVRFVLAKVDTAVVICFHVLCQ